MESLADRVASGSHADQLTALRDFLVTALAWAEAAQQSRDMAPLAAQLRDVLADLGAGRAELVWLRDFLAAQLDLAGARDVAPMAAQLKIVLADIEAMPDEGGGSVVDEIGAARARRRADAARQAADPAARAEVSQQRGA